MFVISKKKINEATASHLKRRQNYRLQRIIGYPEREIVSRSPDDSMICCPYTKIIRKYIPSLGHLVELPVPCGRCMWCKHKFQNQLIYRMYNHSRIYKNCMYVTLTYNDEHLPTNVDDLRSDITRFIKRFRKEFCDKTFSYYMVCEKGDLFRRFHFHLLVFWNGLASRDYVCNLLRSKWFDKVRSFSRLGEFAEVVQETGTIPYTPIGNVYIDRLEGLSGESAPTAIMSYISKYLSDGEKLVVFRSWSNHLGADILGVDQDLFSKMSFLRCIQYQPKDKLYSIAVPKYYKNMCFTQSEQDCFFYEYLISEDYQTYINLVSDQSIMNKVRKNYEAYEIRCREAYELRLREKRRKYKLKRNCTLDK